MILIKRVTVDVRGPDVEADHIVNEELIKLQTNENGKLNPSIEITDVKEISKSSGMIVFVITYDDKGLNVIENPK